MDIKQAQHGGTRATVPGTMLSSPGEAIFGVALTCLSCCGFQLLGKAVECCLTPTSARHAPWKWKNILISFMHAIASSVGALYCFYETPAMAKDLIFTYTTFSHALISFSVGYFISDSIDMALNNLWSSLDLLGHHAVIVMCFGIAILTQHYIGYAVVALIVEINSIFLHLRQLFQVLKVPRGSLHYRINSLINLGTYMLCRIALLAWMTRWIVINRDLIPFSMYTIGSIGLAIMTVMNIVLFYRLLHSDFLRKSKNLTRTKDD